MMLSATSSDTGTSFLVLRLDAFLIASGEATVQMKHLHQLTACPVGR